MVQVVARTRNLEFEKSLMGEGVPSVLARAWASRGAASVKDALGSFKDIIPYTELLGAVEMANILADAIIQGKRLLIIADYDADGATACTIGMRALRGFGANVGYIIPDRKEHGYGLSVPIAKIACEVEPKPDYLITVDNGIASHEGIDYCNSQGVQVLVTDHHLPGETHPNARVIVNPNQHGCTFPSKALAGCGVIFYVMMALQDELIDRGWHKFAEGFEITQLLPIVAVGTIADLVALDHNNRILVNTGMRIVRKSPTFPGLEALAYVAKKDPRKLCTTDIAFQIGPRINAVGRLEQMDQGVECLLSGDPEDAVNYADKLDKVNGQRKEIEAVMTDEALEELVSRQTVGNYTAVVHSAEWHQGVIGIVAGRVKERIWRPTFALADGPKGEHKGSGRSIPGFHLRDALDLIDRRNPGLMPKFGGHAMAAGVTVSPGGVEQFAREFEKVARELMTPQMLSQTIEVDGSLSNEEMSLQTVEVLSRQVWGQMFPEPTFQDVFKIRECREIGDGKHLRLTLEKDGRTYTAIKFRHEDGVIEGHIKAVYKLSANEFRGEVSLQLLIDYFELL